MLGVHWIQRKIDISDILIQKVSSTNSKSFIVSTQHTSHVKFI
jgi:hypothetical protein